MNILEITDRIGESPVERVLRQYALARATVIDDLIRGLLRTLMPHGRFTVLSFDGVQFVGQRDDFSGNAFRFFPGEPRPIGEVSVESWTEPDGQIVECRTLSMK